MFNGDPGGRGSTGITGEFGSGSTEAGASAGTSLSLGGDIGALTRQGATVVYLADLPPSADEGEDVVVHLHRIGDTSTDVTVFYTLNDIDTDAADIDLSAFVDPAIGGTSGRATFTAGGPNTVELRFPTLTDNEVEGTELFTVSLGFAITSADLAYGTREVGAAINDTTPTQPNVIPGTPGPDVIPGTPFADDISALGSDDFIDPGKGNDTIDGGAGVDTVKYTGDQSSYTVRLSATGLEVEDRRADGDGTDQLSGVEDLSFSTLFWDVRLFGDVAGLSEDAFREFVEVYIAYFDRAPDAQGLYFYATAFANGTTLEQSTATFLNSPEYAAAYPPGLSNRDFAEAVYNNVLGRISDPLGLEFWVDVLDSGARTRDIFILEVLKGAKTPPPAGATQEFIDQKAADVAYLANKTDIGIYFAVSKGMNDVDNAKTAMQLFDDGDQLDIDAAVAAIDGFHAAALDPETGEFLLPLVGVVDDPFAGP